MELTAAVLRWAKLENLELLARKLRVVLPVHKRRNKDEYHRALARRVAEAINEEKQKSDGAGSGTEGGSRDRGCDR